jgi:hypothetical protein
MSEALNRHGPRIHAPALFMSAILAVTSLLCACDSGSHSTSPVAKPSSRAAKEKPKTRPVEYRPDGELMESDEAVAGLKLPTGLRSVTQTKTEWTFTSAAPIGSLRAYFAKRLFTSRVDEIGQGAVFRDATPHGADRQQVRLEVSVLPSSKSPAWVRIQQLPPVNPNPMTESQIREALQRDQKRLD